MQLFINKGPAKHKTAEYSKQASVLFTFWDNAKFGINRLLITINGVKRKHVIVKVHLLDFDNRLNTIFRVQYFHAL